MKNQFNSMNQDQTSGLNQFGQDENFVEKVQECLINRAVQDEIDRGVPPHARTKAWYISCPCPKCSPYKY